MPQGVDLAAVSFWANVVGLVCGMTGAFLLYLFGVPRQVDTGGVNFLSLEGDERFDTAEIERIARFKRWGTAGIWLVFFAFLLQLLAAVAGGGT